MPTKQKIEFTPPPGFKIPEGEDKHFDLVCTFEPSETSQGKICMTRFGDFEAPGYAAGEESKEKEPTYDKFGEDVVSALKNQEGPQSPGGPY